MEKTKLLTLLVICLVILNIGLLAYLFLGSRKTHPPKRVMKSSPKEIIIEKLNFNAKQIANYEELIKDHRAKISATEKQNKELKNSLYQFLLKSSENKSIVDSIVNLLGENQKLIENIHFNHFADIKKLCEPDQMESFGELATELSGIFAPPPMPRKK